MASNTPKVSVILELLDKMTAPLNGAKGSVESFGSKAMGVFKAVAASAAALALGKFFKDSVGEAMKAELAFTQLEATVKSTGGAAGFTAKELKGQADALARLTLFSSEAVQGGLARLLGYTDIQGEMFQRATRAALDMAQVLGIDVSSASEKVGNALNYPTQAINSLTKQGFRFTEEQKRMIAEMERSGDIAGAQAIILGELELAYGGSAEAAGNTFAGALDKVGKAWDSIKEAVGRAIIGNTEANTSMGWLVETLAEVEQWVVANEGAISEFAGTVMTALRGVGEIVKSVGSVLLASIGGWLNAFQWLGHAATELGFAWDGIAPAVKKMAGNVLMSLSALIGESRVFLTLFGDAATEMANQMGNAGVRMVVDASRSQRAIKAGRELYYRELAESGERGESALTRTAEVGGNRRRTLTKEELDAIEKARKDAAKRLADLSEEILVKEIRFQHNWTEATAKAYIQRERDLGRTMTAQVTTISAAYTRLDALNTLLAAGFTQRVVPAIKQTTLHIGELGHHAEPVTVAIKQVGAAAQTSSEDLLKTARTAGDAAHSMGLLDDAGKGVFNTMLNVGSAIKDAIAGGWSAGGIIGVVAGVGSLIKGIFGGKSPAQLAAERALQKNTQTIEENSRKVGDLTRLQSSGGKLVGVQGALETALGGLPTGVGGMPLTIQSGIIGQTLAKALTGVGLGIGDLDDVAKDLGITIRNSDGKFLLQGIRDLLTMLGEIEPTQFAETFRGQRDKLRSETSLFDLSPAEQARRLIALAGGPLGSHVLGANLKGFDLDSAEGRASATSMVQALFKLLPTLSAGDLGGLTGSEFLDVLQELKDLLAGDLPAAVATGGTEAVAAGGGGLGDVVPSVGVPVPSLSLADLVKTATRSEYYLAEIAGYTGKMATMTGPAGGAMGFGGIEIHGGLNVSVTTAAGAGGAGMGAEIARALDEELGRLYRERLAALGDVRRT